MLKTGSVNQIDQSAQGALRVKDIVSRRHHGAAIRHVIFERGVLSGCMPAFRLARYGLTPTRVIAASAEQSLFELNGRNLFIICDE